MKVIYSHLNFCYYSTCWSIKMNFLIESNPIFRIDFFTNALLMKNQILIKILLKSFNVGVKLTCLNVLVPNSLKNSQTLPDSISFLFKICSPRVSHSSSHELTFIKFSSLNSSLSPIPIFFLNFTWDNTKLLIP